MKPITLERYLNEPDLALRLHEAARRARAAEVHRLLKALAGRLAPRAEPARWLARIG